MNGDDEYAGKARKRGDSMILCVTSARTAFGDTVRPETTTLQRPNVSNGKFLTAKTKGAGALVRPVGLKCGRVACARCSESRAAVIRYACCFG